jgi:asparagine synthetase B (glutamine-hydrolysing)
MITTDQAGFNMKDVLSSTLKVLKQSLQRRLLNIPHVGDPNTAHVGILFSGGLDSVILAAITHFVLPESSSVELINVAFQNNRFLRQQVQDFDEYAVPDRISGIVAYKELKDLFPNRKWDFVSVNVPQSEYQEYRSHVVQLIRPSDTIMDLSIAIALWFAARSVGLMNESPYHSTAKVLLLGMGADEQLGGYSRHRSAFERDGREALLFEIQMELDRISSRNLGRDDRCIADHGKEARFPFLDEDFVNFLCTLPLEAKCDMNLPRGKGEKQLFRLLAKSFGFSDQVAFLPKRAIQFGAKTAKMESSSERGPGKLDD